MAFNFNWSPLSTDAGFLPRAQELLTHALNRADPKPAIIVDDIVVSELNLGDMPPELEILEIGDLAEDRFRGTFKMMYSGNAFITLKTKVQANPLNTYLRTRPAFASPLPLAADTGLTIPLQITLSDFRLSGFIILVFSRQKGLTLVFRNDPLESLRVSSTFDSIPFVANFLQREIETQLRGLIMDELPAIIHRLSLRLWVPEPLAREERRLGSADAPQQDEVVVDPLASPPQDPVDSTGNVLSPAEIASLSLDSSVETQSLFSRKNLLRLATLTDSNRTLSLFTPTIRDAVFRAWTGPLERGELTGNHTRATSPTLSRSQSYAGSPSTAYPFDTTSPTRLSLYNFPTGNHGFGMGSGRHAQGHRTRKRKKRVVNLRQQLRNGEQQMPNEDGFLADTASVTESTSTAPSIFSAPPATMSSEAYTGPEPVTPNRSATAPTRISTTSAGARSVTGSEIPPRDAYAPAEPKAEAATHLESSTEPPQKNYDATIRARRRHPVPASVNLHATPRASLYLADDKDATDAPAVVEPHSFREEKSGAPAHTGPSKVMLPSFLQFVTDPSHGGSIAERAWMMKMASEIARRYEEERLKGSFGPSHPEEVERFPPPAYAQ